MKSLRRRLFIKFLLGYSVFFLLSLFFVYFYGGNRVQSYFYNTEGASLYREVTRLANYYSKEEFGSLSISKITADMEGNILLNGRWRARRERFLPFMLKIILKGESLRISILRRMEKKPIIQRLFRDFWKRQDLFQRHRFKEISKK